MKTIIKRFEEFNSKELWALRQKVVVNSVYLADYENQYGINVVSLSNFFDGYYDYMWELATEKYGKNVEDKVVHSEFDTEENLYSWYNCYDEFDGIEYDYDEPIEELVKDIIDENENLSAEKVKQNIIAILKDGKYDMNELWHLFIYKSTKLYELLGNYGDYKK